MKRVKGFSHKCPRCGQDDCLWIGAADVARLWCRECEEEMTADELRCEMAALARLLDWLESAPQEGGYTARD